MNDPQERLESSEKRDFLGIFSDHLNSEFKNMRERSNPSDAGLGSSSRSSSTKTNSSDQQNSKKTTISTSCFPDKKTDQCESEEVDFLKNLIPVKRPSTTNKNSKTNMSLVVGDINKTVPLAEMIAQQTVAHRLQMCREEDAYMFCNKEAYSIIWILVTLPASQDLLSLSTSIRYFSKFNKETAMVGLSSTPSDVDLRLHGIDEIILRPINSFSIQSVYKKWTLVQINSAESDLEKRNQKNSGSKVSLSGDINSHHVTVPDKTIRTFNNASNAPIINQLDFDNGFKQLQTMNPSTLKQSPSALRSSFQKKNPAKEKQRRERIKVSCDQLRVLLPYIRGRKTDMASILEMCVDYLKLINSVLPPDTLYQVTEKLNKNSTLCDQRLRVNQNSNMNSGVISQTYSDQLINNSKAIKRTAETLLEPDVCKEDNQLITWRNDSVQEIAIEVKTEPQPEEEVECISANNEKATNNSNDQNIGNKKRRLNEFYLLNNFRVNHPNQPNHIQNQNVSFPTSLVPTSRHQSFPMAMDMRKNLNSRFIPGRDLQSNTLLSTQHQINPDLPVLSHFPNYPVNIQKAFCEPNQNYPSLPNTSNTEFNSKQRYPYPAGVIWLDNGRSNRIYTSAAQAGTKVHYRPENILNRNPHMFLGPQVQLHRFPVANNPVNVHNSNSDTNN